MQGLEPIGDPNLLVGFGTADDAGVYRLDDARALVQTVDFITPVVDDPEIFGRVAAANALSDVYAMGGIPLTALNICCFPGKGLERPVLASILRGGADKVREAGAALVGGHTVQDDELKYGLSVTGWVHPERIVRNSGARAGDALLLTKPLGTGAIISAYRDRRVSDATLQEALAEMTRLNAAASRLMLEHGATACTDITGFGMLGHALGMAQASGAGLRLLCGAIPRYEEALELIRNGIGTRNTRCNLQLARPHLRTLGEIPEDVLTLLGDPQTSGGLFIAVPAGNADALLAALHSAGETHAARVGEVFAATPPVLEVVGA